MKKLLIALNVVKKAGNTFKILLIIESTCKHVMSEIEKHFPDNVSKPEEIAE